MPCKLRWTNGLKMDAEVIDITSAGCRVRYTAAAPRCGSTATSTATAICLPLLLVFECVARDHSISRFLCCLANVNITRHGATRTRTRTRTN